MKTRMETPLYVAVMVVLMALVVTEGRTRAALEARVPLTPRELYQQVGRSAAKVQIVDVRESSDDNYPDTHVPGSIPFPECDPSKAAPAALERILASVPTVIVSAHGDTETFERCRSHFTSARNLAGGLAAWVDANLPEDSGEYVPPKASAGGGCL